MYSKRDPPRNSASREELFLGQDAQFNNGMQYGIHPRGYNMAGGGCTGQKWQLYKNGMLAIDIAIDNEM